MKPHLFLSKIHYPYINNEMNNPEINIYFKMELINFFNLYLNLGII